MGSLGVLVLRLIHLRLRRMLCTSSLGSRHSCFHPVLIRHSSTAFRTRVLVPAGESPRRVGAVSGTGITCKMSSRCYGIYGEGGRLDFFLWDFGERLSFLFVELLLTYDARLFFLSLFGKPPCVIHDVVPCIPTVSPFNDL